MPFSQMMFDMNSDIYDHFGRSFITFIVCRYYLTSRTPIVIVQHRFNINQLLKRLLTSTQSELKFGKKTKLARLLGFGPSGSV